MASLEVSTVATRTDHLLARLPDSNSGSDSASGDTESSEPGMIVSRRGTVRGVQDSVKSALHNFRKINETPEITPTMRKIIEEEYPSEADGRHGQVAVYVTSVQAVRETYEECRWTVQILRNMNISFQLKDILLHPDYRKELAERLETDNPTVPQVFVKGQHLGDGKTIAEMNELSTLRPLLEEFESDGRATMEECNLCGGKKFLLCLWCQGSKKGYRTSFADLKCTVCNENALQRCPKCCSL